MRTIPKRAAELDILKTLRYSTPGGRYDVRLARTAAEVASALRLRHRVFAVELGEAPDEPGALEFDQYDIDCKHLIVVCKATGRTIGTYRLNTAETAGSEGNFYSAGEFSIEELPFGILRDGIEIGRACIDKEHRNTRVLFLLWQGLLRFLQVTEKRYFFGCCSIFTQDERLAASTYKFLERSGKISHDFTVRPKRDAIDLRLATADEEIALPPLFEMYLKLGAEVCGPPLIDREFGTIDYFVVLDVCRMNEKYRQMFNR